MRTRVCALILIVISALALCAAPGIAHADGLSALLPGAGLEALLHLLPVRVVSLVQNALGRPIGPAETGIIVACTVVDAVVVAVVFQLVFGDRGFGLALNGLIALAGVWGALELCDFRARVEALNDLNALVARSLVASVAAPAALIFLKAFLSSEANTFLAGGGTRAGDAFRGMRDRVEGVFERAGRRPKGPSAERIRSTSLAVNRDRRRSARKRRLKASA